MVIPVRPLMAENQQQQQLMQAANGANGSVEEEDQGNRRANAAVVAASTIRVDGQGQEAIEDLFRQYNQAQNEENAVIEEFKLRHFD